MKAVNKQLEEIKRLEQAIEKTKSKHLKNDYQKAIARKKRELKEYCFINGYSYSKIIKSYIKLRNEEQAS